MVFYALEKVSAVVEGYFKPHAVAGLKLLLIHSQGRIFVVDQTCPHAGASLRKARVAGYQIQCPKHGILFDMQSGAPQGGEVVEGIACLNVYSPVIRGGFVGVEL